MGPTAMRSAILLVLAVLLVAGCATRSPSPTVPTSTTIPFDVVAAQAQCPPFRGVNCLEPSLAVTPDGRMFSSVTSCQKIAVSDATGRTWSQIPLPPAPLGARPTATPGDCTMQTDPAGHLWFSALLLDTLGTTQTQELAGIQVARSDDGGRTWAVDTYVTLTAAGPFASANTDRQWLAFAPDGAVYLAWWQFSPGTAFVARSDDGGKTFGPATKTSAIIPGVPAVDSKGALYCPYYTFGTGGGVWLEVSRDKGATFATQNVWKGDIASSAGGLLLSVSVDAKDGLHVVWIDKSGDVLVASSADGHTFAVAQTWSRPGRPAMPLPPFILAHGSSLDVVWSEKNDSAQQFMLARGALASAAPDSVTKVADVAGSKITSDFLIFAARPDGAVSIPIADPERGFLVAMERAPLTAP